MQILMTERVKMLQSKGFRGQKWEDNIGECSEVKRDIRKRDKEGCQRWAEGVNKRDRLREDDS